MIASGPAMVLDVSAVAGLDFLFDRYLAFLAQREVFWSRRERDEALNNAWTGSGPTHSGSLAARPFGSRERHLIVAFTWPNPRGRPVSWDALVTRTAADIRRDTGVVLARLIDEAHGLGVDLRAVLCQLGGLSIWDLVGVKDGSVVLDVQFLLAVGEHGRLAFDRGWICDIWAIEAERHRHEQAAEIAASLDVTSFRPDRIHATLGAAALPPPPDSKYRALFERLDVDASEPVTMTLEAIDVLLREGYERARKQPVVRVGKPETEGLPPVARTNRTWWATVADVTKRPHVRAWAAAGFRTHDVTLYEGSWKRSRVTFAPMPYRELWARHRRGLRDGLGTAVALGKDVAGDIDAH